MPPRVLSILLGAGFGGLLVLVLARGRVSWTTALIGAALIAMAEYTFGDRFGTTKADDSSPSMAHSDPLGDPPPEAEQPSPAQPDWHEAAMTSLPTAAAAAAAHPRFVRRPLDEYRSQQARSAQQCPNCGSHEIASVGYDFNCYYCAAAWTWQEGDHWPDVRPRPNLQEVPHVSETR